MTARETNLVNAFETTLAAQLASGGTSMNLTDDPGVDSPAYFVIDPDNDSNREVILWASGTNHAAATVTRDIDSKHGTDPTHASGTKVRLAVVKQHIEEAHDAIQQGFILEDDDGTEVTINPAVASGVYTAREVKFIGDGVDIDWTDTDNGTDGDPFDMTFTLDINDLSAGTVAVANDSIAILDSDDNATKKESIADLIAAIDGTGLTASSGVLAVDSSQAITALTGGDLTIYDDQNNADVSIKLGTSSTESLSIEVLNGSGNKTAEEIKFSTATASSTANHGKIVFNVDGTDILTIDDGGIDIASGLSVAINGSDLPTSDTNTTYSAGTLLDLSTTTFNVDLSEAAEAAIADGDYVMFLDGGASGTAAKEAIGDIATLFAGSGLTAASSVISNDVIGKQSMWVPAVAMYPTNTGGCAAIALTETTAGRPDMYTLDFDASSDENAQFSIAMPSYWNEGTLTYKVYWTTAATDTDGVAWSVAGVAVSDNDTIDVAFGTAVVVTDDALGAAEDLMVTAESGAVTIAGSPAAGDLCYFNIERDVSDANDDMAEDAKLIGIKLFYTIADVHEA
tara:strand:+ start:24500 stop:26206 length:1707 start_codon:yes stop_codon:yes gene_type:complete